jgi:uncharacterized protein YecT (DUF1311 family)
MNLTSRRTFAALWVGAASALSASGAHAASFDCGKKLSQVETMICADAELSQQDEALAATYGAALKQVGAAQRNTLRRAERQWIADRNNCCALSDIDNEANRIATRRCIAADTSQRIAALKAIADGAPPAVPAADKHGGDEYRRGTDDVLQLAEQADGRTSLAIMAGNARGVCDVELEGRRVAAARFLFTDPDSGCSVSVDLAGNSAAVDSSGACSSFCGAHAPDFTGAYLRKPGPRSSRN